MKTTNNNESAGSAQLLSRGGETFNVQKSATTFVLKRLRGGAKVNVTSDSLDTMEGLTVSNCPGRHELELCHVTTGTPEDAMQILRNNNTQTNWCGHVYHMPNDPDGLLIPTDAIYVELSGQAQDRDVNELLDAHGLELSPDSNGISGAYIMRLTRLSKENPIKIANALLTSPAVKIAEPDLISVVNPAYRPNDTLFDQQWHLENRGGAGLSAGADVKAPQAWDISRGDKSIVVAVIDDGVDTSHPDFSSAGKIVSPVDFGQDDLNPNPVSSIDNHGTSCAGVAVADENGSGVVGLAPNCKLMPIRWSSSISDADIREQFEHPRINGADIISCSWGVRSSFFTLSTSMKRSINRAATEGRNGKGCVIIFAAGNDNRDIDDVAGGTRDGFAIHPNVIAVAASNSRDKRSHYSNFGDAIWVCAPSSGAGGLGIITTDRQGSSGYQSGDYTTVDRFGGTSSATPLVAGLCGLILSVNPDLSAEEVKDILRLTTDKIDKAEGNYDANGHSRLYGYGRINAHKALKEAQSRRTQIPNVHFIQFDSQANLAIPDNNPGGISDSIFVNSSVAVESVQVEVSINHSYRGDLKLELIGPDGTVVTLFGRTHPKLDHRNNVNSIFTVENVPALSNFVGKNAQGHWTLRVSDLASADTGELKFWRLTLALTSQQTQWSVTPGIQLPDNDSAGITSEITVDIDGVLRNIQVEVDITHSYRGDIKVTLIAPNGNAVSLQAVNNRDGEDDLRVTYTTTDSPALQTLVNQQTSIRGNWSLNVSDNLAQDTGKLNAWSLHLIT